MTHDCPADGRDYHGVGARRSGTEDETMRTIRLSQITLTGTDAAGRFAVADVDSEKVGVSLRGEDECVRDLSAIHAGTVVEAGTETMRVVES